MITKERLEELIKEEKGCYILANAYTIGYIHLKEKYEPVIEDCEDNYNLWVFTNDIYDFRDCIHSYSLFETEEEAEWYLEFGNITRTETLVLPSWEEFELLGHNVDFIGKDNTPYHFRFNYNKSEIYIVNAINGKEIYCARPTKENYIEACRLAKKLFLGEEV